MTAARSRLPDRRARLGFNFEHQGVRYVACAGYYGDDRLGELFLSSNKAGSDADANARDSALLFSLLIQHGCPVETIREALTRGSDGRPAGVLGHALELIAEGAQA